MGLFTQSAKVCLYTFYLSQDSPHAKDLGVALLQKRYLCSWGIAMLFLFQLLCSPTLGQHMCRPTMKSPSSFKPLGGTCIIIQKDFMA